VSKNNHLAASVEGALASLPYVQMQVVGSCSEAIALMGDGGAALLLVHVSGRAETEAAGALLHQLAGASRAVPTLVLCEDRFAADGLKLLRLGAADCLMRPLDLSRLAYLVDVLTVRHRLDARPSAERITHVLSESHGFVYRADGALGRILEQARRVATSE